MDNIVLLTCESELESARKMGFESYSNLGSKRTEDFKSSIVINWGFGSNWLNRKGERADFPNTLNDWRGIELNVNKPEALKRISKVVNTPKMWVGGQKIPRNQLVVVRPNSHSEGKDFSVKRGPFVLPFGYYARKYINAKLEYRIFYANVGKHGKFMMWKRVTDNKKLLKEKYKCRSQYGFEYIEKIPNKLKIATKEAFDKSNLLFGAADVLYKGGKYYFLEKNTAPTISDTWTKSFFRDNLIKMCQKKFKKFNFEQWKQMAKLPNCVKVNLFE